MCLILYGNFERNNLQPKLYEGKKFVITLIRIISLYIMKSQSIKLMSGERVDRLINLLQKHAHETWLTLHCIKLLFCNVSILNAFN